MTRRGNGDGAPPVSPLDDALRGLGGGGAPPLGDLLEAELADLAPQRTRSPRRDFALAALVSLAYAAVLLAIVSLRRDLAALPPVWLVLYCAAWFGSFSGLAWFALVPAQRQVMPRWRAAGVAAALVGLGFTAGGLLLAEQAPGLSSTYDASVGDVVRHAYGCVLTGVLTAAVPVVLGALLLRGAVPVGGAWIGAALGAMGGALGGLVLQLHCPIADRWHLGFAHGGLVLLTAAVAALLLPRALR